MEPEVESQSNSQPPSRAARWLRRLKIAVVAGAIALAAFLALVYSSFASPPPLEGHPAVLDAVVTTSEDGRRHLGACWFQERKGASMLYVEGDPFTIGYSNAKLTEKLLAIQELALVDLVRAKIPSDAGILAVATLVLINNRSLPSYVRPEHQLEILGLSMGSEDPCPELGPRYHRILNYHAAHDIAHWVWDKPMVGCTAFAARGPRTEDGRLLIGRTFDFEAGRHFDENKIIGLYRPDRGQAFLSVSWPGMAGVVTGINAQKIYCSINGAHSEDKGRIGKPVSLVVREVLQDALTLEDAVRIVREAEVFVTDGYLIADGKTGEAVVVEKSPARTEVRAIEDDLLLQANHFETPGFQADTDNAAHFRDGSTASRRKRLEELLAAAPQLDVAAAVGILRDRTGPGGAALALGNRGSINALIATHAVVADVTRGVLWVSRGPHQLGRFDAYSIETFGGAPPEPPVPADPFLTSGGYERVQRSRELIAESSAKEEGDPALLRAALDLNPGDPKALFLLGQALANEGRQAEARQALESALNAAPPYRADRDAIKAALADLE